MPLTGQMLHSTLPFYPSLTVIEGEPTYIHKPLQQNLQEQATPPSAAVGGSRQHPAAAATVYHTAAPITDTQVAHARLHKAGHRPLGSMFPLCLRRSPYRARALFQWDQWFPPRKLRLRKRGWIFASVVSSLSRRNHSRAKHSTRFLYKNPSPVIHRDLSIYTILFSSSRR